MSYTVTSPQSAPNNPPITSSLIDSAGVGDDSSGVNRYNPLALLRNKRMEEDTVRYLDSLFERAKTARWRFERQWYVNLSYYFGRQWVSWLNNTSADIARLYEPQAPPWRVRLVINRIKPAIRREMSKVMKEKPTAYVIPSSTDDSDVAAAKAGEAIFEHLWRELNMQKSEMWVAQFWRCITGTGFIKDWWDPHAEGSDAVGTVCVEVVTPFHLYFANLEQYNIDKQEFIIHVAMKSPAEVETMYSKKVSPDSVERGGGIIESQYLQALNLEPGKVSQVAVKEIWIKPNVKYPAGAMFVWAGGKLLYSSDDPATGDPRWPLYKMEYPFTKFDGVPTGRFYGDSTILDLLPIQKEYNRTRSQIIEAKNQTSKPQLIAPKGSIDPSKITSEPGLVILYTPGYQPPTQLQLSPLPNYVLQELDRSLLDMADISGQHEVSSGTVPQGVTAASALAFLQESDDTMLAPIVASIEAGVERIGRHFLCHAHQYWDEPHTIKILGPDNTWEVREFSRIDLRGSTDLNVQAGSAMPRSIAAKQAFIMELAKMQIIGPEEVLRYLEMAETGRMYEDLQIDRRQAERENMKMSDVAIIQASLFKGLLDKISGANGAGGLPTAAGGEYPMQPDALGQPVPPDFNGGEQSGAPVDSPMMPSDPMMQGNSMMGLPPSPPVVPVNSWDNHEVHIKVHNDYRKRQEFDSLDPQLKDEFEKHVELHRAALGMPPTINPEQMQAIVNIQASQQLQEGGVSGVAPTNEPGALPAQGQSMEPSLSVPPL